MTPFGVNAGSLWCQITPYVATAFDLFHSVFFLDVLRTTVSCVLSPSLSSQPLSHPSVSITVSLFVNVLLEVSLILCCPQLLLVCHLSVSVTVFISGGERAPSGVWTNHQADRYGCATQTLHFPLPVHTSRHIPQGPCCHVRLWSTSKSPCGRLVRGVCATWYLGRDGNQSVCSFAIGEAP